MIPQVNDELEDEVEGEGHGLNAAATMISHIMNHDMSVSH